MKTRLELLQNCRWHTVHSRTHCAHSSSTRSTHKQKRNGLSVSACTGCATADARTLAADSLKEFAAIIKNVEDERDVIVSRAHTRRVQQSVQLKRTELHHIHQLHAFRHDRIGSLLQVRRRLVGRRTPGWVMCRRTRKSMPKR